MRVDIIVYVYIQLYEDVDVWGPIMVWGLGTTDIAQNNGESNGPENGKWNVNGIYTATVGFLGLGLRNSEFRIENLGRFGLG